MMVISYHKKIHILCLAFVVVTLMALKLRIRVSAYTTEGIVHDLQRVEILQFYSVKDAKPSIYMDAYYLEAKNQFQEFDFINPKGQFYGKSPEDKRTDFSSQRLNYSKLTNMANFKGDVVILRDPLKVDCQIGTFWTESEKLFCKERVKVFGLHEKTRDEITINSDVVNAFFKEQYSIHEDNVFGQIKRPLLHEPPTDFSSQNLTFYFEQGQANLEGNVHVTHGEYDVKSRRGEILIENYNKKLKYFSFDDDVVVEQKSKKIPGGKRYAYGEKMESVRSQGTVVLTGAPRVLQGRDIIKGNKITLREGASLIEVDDAASNIIYEENKELR